MKFNKKVLIFLISFFIVGIFYNSLLLNIFKPLNPQYIDASGAMFTMKHVMDTFLSGNFSNLPNLPDFYGFKNSLFYSNNLILQSLLALPIYFLTRNIFITYNIFVFLSLLFSFFITYLFAFYVTKKTFPSLITAVIFVFNPFVSLHVPDSPDVFSLYWIALIFLFFEKYINTKKNWDGFLFFIFLSMQLLSSVYFAIFLTLILPIYVIGRSFQKKLKWSDVIKPGVLLGSILFTGVVLVLAYFYLNVGQGISMARDLATLSIYSPTVFNWLVAPSGNLIYGSIGDNVRNLAPAFFNQIQPSEFSYFIGLIPLIILIIGIRIHKKSGNNFWRLNLLLLIISFIICLGPLIQFTKYLNFPGPFILLYYLNPLFQYIRVIGRFAVFVFLFLGILGSLTLIELMKKFSVKKSIIIFTLVLFLIFIEYLSKPLQFVSLSQETKQFYSYLKNREDIKVILDLPIGNRLDPDLPESRNEVYDGRYFYWQMIHKKILFNGNSSYLPDLYVEKTNYLSLGSINNYKIEELRNWGVDAIVIHKSEFKKTDDYYKMKNNLVALKIPLIQETDKLSLFDLTKL